MNADKGQPQVAVLLPCYNEALTIVKVIEQMRETLPAARIVVFDNNSKDGSGELARNAGAEVRDVKLQGKGNVVHRMFSDVDADVYLMLDADTTYDPKTAPALIDAIWNGGNDMACGVRKGKDESFPPGHKFGNMMFNLIVAGLFGRGMQDIFSGYRAFSRRFAKSFPAHSAGFEIETEISVFTLEQRIPFTEIPSPYGERPEGSFSKLHTFRDGFRILWTIAMLYKDMRPMMFFGLIALFLALVSLGLGVPVILEYLDTHQVTRQPTAILASAIGTLATLIFVAGMVLNGVARSYREARHLCYLNVRR
ncbi:MAG TPA: glycosyltransferase [Patescibacteria group bacterium]|nr:glycosyltransferase [Patescibacteria group bacterium]